MSKRGVDRRQDKQIKRLFNMMYQVLRPEVKTLNIGAGAAAMTTALAQVSLTAPIIQGVTNATRIGNKIRLIGCDINAVWNNSSETANHTFRWFCYKLDGDSTAGVPAVTDLLTSASVLAPYNYQGSVSMSKNVFGSMYKNKNEVRIVHDHGPAKWMHAADPDGTGTQTTHSTDRMTIRKKLGWTVDYAANTGASTDHRDGNFIMASFASNVAVIQNVIIQLYFTDG